MVTSSPKRMYRDDKKNNLPVWKRKPNTSTSLHILYLSLDLSQVVGQGAFLQRGDLLNVH